MAQRYHTLLAIDTIAGQIVGLLLSAIFLVPPYFRPLPTSTTSSKSTSCSLLHISPPTIMNQVRFSHPRVP